MKRAAIYVRVSTDKQTIENQVAALRQVAERRGWKVAEQYSDAGISGAKGREGRPGLDQMLKDTSKRRFDVVMSWAIDRLGRSLIDLLGTIQTLEAGETLGRPKIAPTIEKRILRQLQAGKGILKVARELGVGTGTVQRIKD